MHTMHHRSKTTSLLDDSGKAMGNSPVDAATGTPATGTPERRRRLKRASRNSSAGLMTLRRTDLILAIFSACFLTVLCVLILLKLYTMWMPINAPSAPSTASTTDDGSYDEESVLPWNPKYRVPLSMPIVGDRSTEYVTLRQQTDTALPVDATRSRAFVQSLVASTIYGAHNILTPASQDHHHSDQVRATYDIYDCPPTPPPGYPFAWNAQTVLENWPPDDTSPPASGTLYQGLCVFDYTTDYDTALTYRQAELPFVVTNDPAVAATVERWNRPGYMEQLMGNVNHRTEYSANNHFMYYVPPPRHQNRRRTNVNAHLHTPKDWVAPTKMMRMPYAAWVAHANVTDDHLGPHNPHWYYRLIGCGGTGNDGSCDKGASEYLFDELTFFQPKESLYIVEPEEQKGIHCRFGMKGVIAENHFDGSRNSIVVLGGSRRYILSHPNQCEKLALYPKGHPSARHSAVDWSDPDYAQFPQFADALLNEVVLLPGQVLYLPTEWFHYIVSLELNFQCNTRSGITAHYHDSIRKCGF